MKLCLLACLSFSPLVLISPRLSAQSHVYTFTGKASGDRFGFSANPVGDVDGDGYVDVVIGAPGDDTRGTDAGRAVVISGRHGREIYSFFGDSSGDEFGWSVNGAGDVNKDGVPDIVVGSPFDDPNVLNAGSVFVFSGKDGSTLHAFHGKNVSDSFGISVDGAGDVDKDGYADIVVGVHADDTNGTNAGAAKIFSGRTGQLLRMWTGSAAGDFFGHSVAGAGDIDKDGAGDIIVGAPNNHRFGTKAGLARLLSGATGRAIRSTYGSPGDLLGHSVANAGDLNKDGTPDQIVGANQFFVTNPGKGFARVYSGASGKVLMSFSGTSNGDFFGEPVSGAGDVDGDGWPDLLVGAHRADFNGTDSGAVTLFSGRTGQVLFRIDGERAGDYFGHACAIAGDVDKDGVPDLIAGAYQAQIGSSQPGRAYVFSGTELPLVSDRHEISLSHLEAQTLQLNAGKRNASKVYIMLGSMSGTSPGVKVTSNLTLPLNFDPYMLFLGGSPNSLVQNSVGILDAQGRGTARFAITSLSYPPSIVGTLLHHGYLLIDLSKLSIAGVSNAVPLTLDK